VLPRTKIVSALVCPPRHALSDLAFARFCCFCHHQQSPSAYYTSVAPDLQRNRRRLEQEWLAASARCARNAEDGLGKASAVVTEDIPGQLPDVGLATAWAAIGEGWAVLAAAEATRSAATAVMPAEQTGIE
jgi:hypothetical protein